MSLRIIALVALSSGACFTPDARADYYADTPPIAFEEEPGLVEIAPGIAVVPDCGEEVFFTDGWYWHRWHGNWFHSSDWRGGWEIAPPPPVIVGLPSGHYRNWHSGPMIRPGRPVIVRPPHPGMSPPPSRVPPPQGPQGPHGWHGGGPERGPVVAPQAPTHSPGRMTAPPPPLPHTAPASRRPVQAPPPPPSRPAHHFTPPPSAPPPHP